jgi:hypothetical protein
MLESVLMSVAVCGAAPYSPPMASEGARPIASAPAYPAGMADDVRRPGYNGRLYVTRPILGALQDDFQHTQPRPELDQYGAYLTPCASVPARAGHLVVSVSPWHQWERPGHTRYEHARQFWLEENNYTGGVRTHVNDYYLWRDILQPREPGHVAAPAQLEPAAIIELSPDAPRHRNRLRVDADTSAAAAILREQGLMRISWPHAAPRSAMAGTEGGFIQSPGPRPVVITAK